MKLIEKFTDIQYQRNGVGGVGFHVVQFIMREGHLPAQAIVFSTDDDDKPLRTTGYCAVTTADLRQHWRGDRFEPELREFIAGDEGKAMCWPTLYGKERA
jgi:hypothetical protein